MVLLSEKELKIQKYNSSKWQARSNPDILKQSANEKMDAYTDMLVQVIKDLMGVLESIGQSISDTVKEEGIMYVTGYGGQCLRTDCRPSKSRQCSKGRTKCVNSKSERYC